MQEKINNVLDKLRPYLINDGGDVEFVKFEDGVVYLKLLGQCVDCVLADSTVKDMIEYTLTFEIPEIKEVKSI